MKSQEAHSTVSPRWIDLRKVFFFYISNLDGEGTNNHRFLFVDTAYSITWLLSLVLVLLKHGMMTSSNGNIFRITGHLCGEFTGPRRIPRTKAGQCRGALMFFSIRTRINGWVNNGDAGVWRRHRAHYDVAVMDVSDFWRAKRHIQLFLPAELIWGRFFFSIFQIWTGKVLTTIVFYLLIQRIQ